MNIQKAKNLFIDFASGKLSFVVFNNICLHILRDLTDKEALQLLRIFQNEEAKEKESKIKDQLLLCVALCYDYHLYFSPFLNQLLARSSQEAFQIANEIYLKLSQKENGIAQCLLGVNYRFGKYDPLMGPVSILPDIFVGRLSAEDANHGTTFILACDGIWDVMDAACLSK